MQYDFLVAQNSLMKQIHILIYFDRVKLNYWHFNLHEFYFCCRVIELEKRREKIAQASEYMNKMEIKNEPEEDEESDGSDLDEFIDWRSKS